MAQQVQELINKIKNEGIQAAEKKARDIEAEATKKAEETVRGAKIEAQKIVDEAKKQSQKITETTRSALQQTARDMMLLLRKEINNLLQAILAKDVKETLTIEQLAELIARVIKGYFQTASASGDISVAVSEKDLKKLSDTYLAKLQDSLKQPIQIKAVDYIGEGFSVSFDGGRSCFDFSDESLVQYLAGYLNTEVAGLLKEAVKKET